MKLIKIILGFSIFLVGFGITFIPYAFLLGFLVGIVGLYIVSDLLPYDMRGVFITFGGLSIYTLGMYHLFNKFLVDFLLSLIGGLMAAGSCRNY